MEVMLEGPSAVKGEKMECDVDGVSGKDTGKIANETPSCEGDYSKSCSPYRKDSSISKQEEQLESTKAEMGEVREENERLKTILAKIVSDYQSLQVHFFDVVRQEQDKKPAETTPDLHQETEEHEFISLRLGSNASGHKSKEDQKAATSPKCKEHEQMKGLTLGLDCKFDRSSSVPSEPQSNLSPENSFEEPKEEEAAGEPWPPSKILKTLRSGDDHEASQQAQVKKARVSVRARCDAPTMNDGCQWRKYGQKIAKGNPCPRAYYRCTVAPACPVRKQVQRCAEDMSILITTYEGTHNHPLPISATAMASTTSAAACMLTSGSSSTSRPAIGAPSAATGANAGVLHGLNFGILDNNSIPRQFFLPNPSITSTPSYPTITLDLTSPPSYPVSSSSTQFSKFPSNFSSSTAPRYNSSTTSLNFSCSDQFKTSPIPWSNGWSQAYSNKSLSMGSFNPGRHNTQEPFYQSYMQKTTNSSNLPPAPTTTHQHPLTDTIVAATKAITADPSFQSALAAAITSIVGGHGSTQSMGESLSSQSLKWGDQHFASANSPYPSSTANGNGCASSYLNRPTAGSSTPNTQPANLMFLQPSLDYSNSKSASTSPISNREHTN